MNEKSKKYFSEYPYKYFSGVGSLRIAYKDFADKNLPSDLKSAIVFLTGQGEPIEKYSELFLDLQISGFRVFAMDHRGQGHSERILQDKPHLGYVENFADYVEDLHIFVREIVKKETAIQNVFLISHSMGGAVCTMFALTHPEMINGMVLSAPMYDVVTSPYPSWLARWITSLTVKVGLGKSFPIGKSSFNVLKEFRGNPFTGSLERFLAFKKLSIESAKQAIQGPTNKWVDESFKAMKKILDSAYRLKTPTLILQAGREQILISKAQNQLADEANRAGGFVKIHRFDQSEHEIFFEQDFIRKAAIQQALEFLNSI